MIKPRVLVTDKYDETAIAEARKFADVDEKTLAPDQLLAEVGNYDAMLVRSATKVTKDVIAAAKNLKFIGRAGVGLDNIDLESAKARGIEVVNSPEASSISVAEHAMALLLGYNKLISKADKAMKAGNWEKKKLKTEEVYEKTLGIIGFGRIGREVAVRAKAFGIKVVAYDPVIKADDVRKMGVEPVSLDELLKTSDYVTLHVPDVESTRGMINAGRLALMKKNAVLVNTARGTVVDEKALIKALQEGRIRGAALDVYEKEPLDKNSPLSILSNVVLTPHIAANTKECQMKGGMMVVGKMRDFFSKKQ
ncbi:MAG: hydroxyacid dehydrogenase [Candidatus Altiarchaeota archaeon]|nr:hydroxyacid dehydrogenase [Candidatus Altiarchaeota archaeon]